MLIVPCAVIVREGKVLATRRPLHKEQGGKWESPGGKADEGETEPEALAREILEELGVRVAVGERICQMEGHPPELRKSARMIFYRCHILPGEPEPRPLAASELGWFTPEEFLALDLCLANFHCRAEIVAAVEKVMEPLIRRLAREAYERYAAVTDWKNYQGLPMPQFDALGDKIQEAWCAAVLPQDKLMKELADANTLINTLTLSR